MTVRITYEISQCVEREEGVLALTDCSVHVAATPNLKGSSQTTPLLWYYLTARPQWRIFA